MERKKISRTYQMNLFENLSEEYHKITNSPDLIASAKKILVQMRYFMTHYTLDDDIIDDMSILVDKIMDKLNMTLVTQPMPSHHMYNGKDL